MADDSVDLVVARRRAILVRRNFGRGRCIAQAGSGPDVLERGGRGRLVAERTGNAQRLAQAAAFLFTDLLGCRLAKNLLQVKPSIETQVLTKITL